MSFRVIVVSLLIGAPASAAVGQARPSIVDAATRAATIIDAAVRAHGGPEALAAAQRIHLTLQGQDIWRNQSADPKPPYDARSASVDLFVDLDASRVVVRQTGAYPGDLHFSTRRVTDGERAHRVFEQSGVHRIDRAAPAQTLAVGLFQFLPQLAVAAAQDDRGSLRFLGKVRLSTGATVDAVVMGTPQGLTTLGFDPATGQLRALLDAQPDPLAGDASVETIFLDYRPLGGVLLPSRRVSYVAGEKTGDLRYTSAVREFDIPDSLLAIPAGSKALVRTSAEQPRELAPGIWDIQEADTHVLAVAFTDFVVVVEAPSGIAGDIVSQVAKVAPGKPIRYVVPTHHHDDHSGGVPEFVASGATLVTTTANRLYFERMLSARSLLGEAKSARPRAAAIELVSNGRRVFTDGSRTLEIHDLGPNEHAKELLVAWIPDAGILYEADMITTAPNGDVVPGANMKALAAFADRIKQKGWSVRQLAGTHHPPVSPTVIAEILAQPLRQP